MAQNLASDPEGWMQDPMGEWSLHFHQDQLSWANNKYVFMDKGKSMNDGSPALLKSRRHLPKRAARKIWNGLQAGGWKVVDPQWGLDLEP